MSCAQPPALAYLGINPEGEFNIKRVPAPDGSTLARLRNMAEELADALGCESYAAVLHLLTGGILAPSAVRATFRYRLGRTVYGDTHPMKLEIFDPVSVTDEELLSAFREERSIESPWNQPRQRAGVALKSERVAAFVEEYPGMSWAERLAEWNQQNPEEPYRTESALKTAFYRANRR